MGVPWSSGVSRWVLSGAQCVPSAVLIKYRAKANGDTDAFCYVFGGLCGYSGKAEGSGIEVLKFSHVPVGERLLPSHADARSVPVSV